MRSYSEMNYHPDSERLVDIVSNSKHPQERLFFRTVVGYYFATMAGMMNCYIRTHEGDKVPVNVYAIPLGPSGFGKTKACNTLDDKVVNQFHTRFMEETFPLMAEQKLHKLAHARAVRNASDPDDERAKIQKGFEDLGPLLYSFDSATQAAVKQARHKILMGDCGALNLQMDEVGLNLSGNMEAMHTYLELFDMGRTKQKLIKNSRENSRFEDLKGDTPANALLFGVPPILLDAGKVEEDFFQLLTTGYARRCIFAYVKESTKTIAADITAETVNDVYARRTSNEAHDFLDECSNRFAALADPINIRSELVMSETVAKLFIEYNLVCEQKAARMKDHEEIRKAETTHRFFKAMKLAGAYAFVDLSPEITEEHAYNAIKLVEDSGKAFEQILHREQPYVKLAKYMAGIGRPVTQADLTNDLPYYKGSKAGKDELMQLAIAHGYQNNIIIKRDFSDGIEFLRGETLQGTDLNQMVVAYSNDIAVNYINDMGAWDEMHQVVQAPGIHWINHHLKNGHRQEDNIQEGFNMVVLDVDDGTSLEMAKELLKDFKALYYTTKRHDPNGVHRFRIVLPMSHHLKLDAKDFKQFMKNIYDWLPFKVDDQTGQRARKWMSHKDHYEYNEGDLLDVLPFIPKTSKNDELRRTIDGNQSLDNLERWFVSNTGDGNRNNQLLRYAMILVDAGLDFDGIRRKVLDFNLKLPDNLSENEIMGTIMVTVGKALTQRSAA